MKRSGRSNSARGLQGIAYWTTSSRWILNQPPRVVQPLIGMLISLALASTAAPVLAGANAGSSVRLLFAAAAPPAESSEQGTRPPTTTTEISSTAAAVVPPPPVAGQSPAQPGSADYDDGVIRYEHAKNPNLTGPPIGSLDDFMSEGDITSPLGFEVREDKRRLKTGEETQGLLIVDVFAGSPAAHAGLHPYHRAMRDALETAAVAGALFLPPVVLLVPVFDQVRLGESYDLIIGVDGSRVTNFLDFQDRLRDLQAGEIVYLSIVRNGQRMQISVPVPENLASPAF